MHDDSITKLLSKTGLVVFALLIVLLFFGLTAPYLFPNTAVAKLTNDSLGRLVYTLLVVGVGFLLEKIGDHVGVPFRKPNELDND